MLGRLLCKLGVHDNIVTGRNEGELGNGLWQSVWGGCIRCNKTFQWDN
jgi:hypothetical protein